YTDTKGNTAFYDQKGRPLRKAFLKSPLPFTRISSGYSMSRMHPILKYIRPHQGIDYAAPTGTPISTVADGFVAQVGSNSSQGRFVRVTHSNGYETIYNHMSKFAKVSKKGTKVKQGQVIGYVGSTGYSTGPHLDFRMKLNGKLIDPLKLKTMPADPIAAKEMPSFNAAVAAFRTELEKPVQAAKIVQGSAVN
ncbi:MAG: M23 family metallopeptidase, partial [Desulfomicrobium sp.]|nr:M23 family metallopeptidase [Desulfomicrobium sp.]